MRINHTFRTPCLYHLQPVLSFPPPPTASNKAGFLKGDPTRGLIMTAAAPPANSSPPATMFSGLNARSPFFNVCPRTRGLGILQVPAHPTQASKRQLAATNVRLWAGNRADSGLQSPGVHPHRGPPSAR